MTPGGDYYASPDQEKCQVASDICTTIPSQRFYCKTEGRSILICNNDLKRWRDRVSSTNAERFRLELKCPLCADWTSPTNLRQARPERQALQGPLAQTLDKAMHAEGLLIDQRQRILQRLKDDAPWLASSFIEPGFISNLESGPAADLYAKRSS
jgi:hypothetical protein